jgi:hypothetical protein
MKRCFKCGIQKPLSDFYRHSKMADGYLGKCKECTKRETKVNRLARWEYYSEYDLLRAKDPNRKKYLPKDPVKSAARRAVTNAIRRGRLVPMPCEKCGAEWTEFPF